MKERNMLNSQCFCDRSMITVLSISDLTIPCVYNSITYFLIVISIVRKTLQITMRSLYSSQNLFFCKKYEEDIIETIRRSDQSKVSYELWSWFYGYAGSKNYRSDTAVIASGYCGLMMKSLPWSAGDEYWDYSCYRW